MNVLVTGTTGLVGEAVGLHLAQGGHRVVGLSRHINQALPADITQVTADLADPESLKTLAKGPPCDAVVHCAADRNPAPGSPGVVLANCLGTQQVIDLARKWNAQSLVYMSGVAVIGRPVRLPIDEDHPVCPLNEYVAAKLFGEYLAGIAAREGMAAATLRLTAPVGARMPGNRLLAAIVGRAVRGERIDINGDGSRRQNYVDVADVALAVEQAIGQRVRGVFNIGGPGSISNLELARLCCRIVNSDSEIALSGKPDPEDGVAWDVSSAKAEKTFAYHPRVKIEDTIQSLAK